MAKNQKNTLLAGSIFLFVFFFFSTIVSAGTLSCTFSTAAACLSPSVVVLRMSSSTNAHSQLPSLSGAKYANNVMCCSGVTGLGNSCSGLFTTVLGLASTTNSHVQESSVGTYTNLACLSVAAGNISSGYSTSTCAASGFDATLGSMSSTTNAHVGTSTEYAIQICATAANQSLTFSLSTSTVAFGAFDSANARFASSTTGASSETEAHSFSVSTNAASGYFVTVQGGTLTNGIYTINSIGGTNTASAPGTEQFGMRIVPSGGSGSVTAPYAASGFAFAAGTSTASQVASAGTGDGVTTTYSVRYIANIATITEPGSYSTNLVYVATANF